MTKQPQRSEFDIFRRRANIVRLAPPAADGDLLTVDVIWGTEYAVTRSAYDWSTGQVQDFEEIIPFTPEACDLTRFQSGNANVLDSHMDFTTEDVVGRIVSAEIRDKQGFATIQISNAPGLEDFRAKVRDGTLRNISVGYNVSEWTIEEKEGQTPKWTATRWEPMEISFVPIPADPNAAVIGPSGGRSTHVRRFQCSLTRAIDRRNDMDPTTAAAGNEPGTQTPPVVTPPVVTPPATGGDNVVAIEEARRQAATEARAAERARVADIRRAARAFGFTEADADPFIADEAATVHSVREALQARLEAQSAANRPRPGLTVQPGFDNAERRRALVLNALENRASGGRVALEADARTYRGLRLTEMARQYLSDCGVDVRGVAPLEIATMATKRAAEWPSELQHRATSYLSTSDFPLILANTAVKRLRTAYNQAPSLWKDFSRQSNAPDFKTRYITQLSEAPRLTKVYEGGEYKYGKFTEDGTNWALSTYGVIIPITRQAIINDDLRAFDRIPQFMGRAAMDNESDIVWALITSNPTMSDGNALFSSAHGNYTSSGTQISINALGVARALLRAQKNIGALEYLNLQARFLVVPPEQETLALQYTAMYTPQTAANVNPFSSLTVIVEPRLSANSTTAWYLIADPAQIDTIEYGYLDGQEGLYTETQNGWEVDGIEIKARDDFGAQVIDWRGFYKNAGA